MNNRDIFQFPFVDRAYERSQISNFITNNNGDTNILWISGPQGAGKTSFVEHYFSTSMDSNYVMIRNVCPTSEKSYIKIMLKALQDYSGLNFKDFLKTNFESIIDVAKNITIGTLKTLGFDLEHFIESLADSSKLFFSHKKTYSSSSRVLAKYLLQSIGEKTHFTVVLDDFSYCDSTSLTSIMELISECMNNTHVKFVIISEDGVNNAIIEKRILQEIPVEHMSISFFKNPLYFYEILLYRFDMTNRLKENINNIYSVCNGSPELLKNLLMDAWNKQNITIEKNKDKAVLGNSFFDNLLCNNFTFPSFDKLGITERLIIYILVSISNPISNSLIKEMVSDIGNKLFYIDLSQNYDRALLFLLDRGVVSLAPIGLAENSIFLFYQSEIQKWNSSAIMAFHLLNYIRTNENKLKTHGWFKEEIALTIARLSYQAQTNDWFEITLFLCKELYRKNSFNSTTSLWTRLIAANQSLLSEADRLVAIDCYFQAGEYNEAINILNTISIDNLSNRERYKYCMLAALLGNITLEKNIALLWIVESYKYCQNETDQIETKNLHQQILIDLCKDKKQATDIFNSILDNFNWNKSDNITICHVIRSSTIYYKGKKARSLLSKGLNIARLYNNILEEAYLLTNYGFALICENNFQEANNVYSQAYQMLSGVRYHEASYCLSNLAVCKMIDYKYDEAINYIIRALLCNKSQYVDYVLRINLAICYEKTNRIPIAKSICERIVNSIELLADDLPTVKRKIYNNAAILFFDVGEKDRAMYFAQKGKVYSENTSSYFRNKYYCHICSSEMNECFQYHLPINHPPKYEEILHFDPWFLTITHD